MKRLLAAVVAAGLAATAASAQPAPKKPRVMSLSQCTDQILLMLAPPERITSVTYLAEPNAVTEEVRRNARRVRINHGLAEEVLAEKPDLLLSGEYNTPATRRLAKKVGIPLLEVASADSFEGVRKVTLQIGEAIGERAKAEALIARMDADLAELARTAPRRKLLAVGWSGSGRAPGKNSMFNDILTAAGGINLAARPGPFESDFNLEELLALNPQPDLLLYGASGATRATFQAGVTRHPVLQRAYANRRVSYPEATYVCGVPQSTGAAWELRRVMLAALNDGAVR